ncbi:MAG: hypothetical protein WCB99_04135 [Candidatus Cybelea sp.]
MDWYLVLYLVVGVVVIYWAWWVRIPDPPGKKARDMGFSLVAAAVAAVAFGICIFAVSSWMSLHIGGQPLRP